MKYTKKQIQESIKHWEAVLEEIKRKELADYASKAKSNPVERPEVKKFIDDVEAKIIEAAKVGKYSYTINFYDAPVEVAKLMPAIIKYFEEVDELTIMNGMHSKEKIICWNDTEDQLKESEHKHITRDEIYARTQAARARMAENCEDTK